MPVRLAPVAVALALATLGGVTCRRAAESGDLAPVADAAPVLTFTNQANDVVTVYGLRPGGDAVRLASVSPGRTETLRLTAGLSTGGRITILAVPLAGNRVASSGPISIGRGTRLAITLPISQNILTVLPAP